MDGGGAHIEVTIDTEEPIELGDFVSAFTSIANQYERYMKREHPDLRDDAKVYVREVRTGSIIADLVPHAGTLISLMDQILIVRQFVHAYGERLSVYLGGNGRLDDASKGELDDLMKQVGAIAKSKNGKGQIAAVVYENGQRQVRAAVTFNTNESRAAIKQIEDHRKALDAISSADRQRVLMVFKRSDVGSADVGVKSGERVIIESLSDRDLPLIYGSSLAEERIKDQMRNIEENIYHKGFVVDVNVQTRGGRPAAYAVTHVHQIIDLDV
ncbi:hypothetical protein NUH88_05595 [Nisaea acidiphila]|uniref:Uncharacterized protein n=1 Tax=Nisaea acidiphila TaxID=1862145 RepID=A0A9J7ATX4_9PROT|nr:hypothetical protein [Nisaea acidiphila]UUX51163.1 hypothetical protein NUH88_05595 [Nisaea acidiphila]